MRKGQVTLFVIIGILILAVVGIVTLLPSEQNQTLAATQEATTITAMVQQCLAQVGEDSITLLGAQGGYIDFTQLADVPTRDTQVVSMPLQKIPLWHEVHKCTQNPNGCVGDNHPALCRRGEACPIPNDAGDKTVSIQENIELLVERNIASCLNDFSSTPNILVEIVGEPDVTATIRNEDVVLILEYPLTITTTENQQIDLEEFTALVQVSLPQTYELARKIQLLQRENQFLEEIFLNLLTVYAGIDQPLPPFRDTQFTGAPRTWVRSEVQSTIEQGLLPFLSFTQIINAQQGYVPVESPDKDETYGDYANGVYEYMEIKLDESSYPLAVKFEYPDTPMYLDVNGEEFLKPRRMPDTGVLRLLGLDIRDYRFRYTAAFPMVVRVHDPAAFNGKGFTLNFGLEANIKNNHPLNTSQGVVEVSVISSTLDLADESQLVDKLHTIRVVDESRNTAVEDAVITYACGTEFSVGVTDEAGRWEGRLPYCISGGHIIITKENYLRTSVERNNVEEGAAAPITEIGIWPLQTKTVTVYKRIATDVGNMTPPFTGTSRQYRTALGENDSVILQFARQRETPYDEEVPIGGLLQFGGSSPANAARNSVEDLRAQLDMLLETGDITRDEYDQLVGDMDELVIEEEPAGPVVTQQSVALVPGEYAVEGTLINTGLIQIPEDRRCQSSLGGLQETCSTLPAQNFSSWVSGGVLLTGDRTFVLTPEDIYSSKNITIFILEQPLPKTWRDMERTQGLEQYQTYDRQAMVTPEIN